MKLNYEIFKFFFKKTILLFTNSSILVLLISKGVLTKDISGVSYISKILLPKPKTSLNVLNLSFPLLFKLNATKGLLTFLHFVQKNETKTQD